MTTKEQASNAAIGARLYHAESTIAKLKKLMLADGSSDPTNEALIEAVKDMIEECQSVQDWINNMPFRNR